MIEEQYNKKIIQEKQLKTKNQNLFSNSKNYGRKKPHLSNQLLSPRLTTYIDNYRDLLIDDDQNKNQIISGNENIFLFEKKQNEILTRAKMNLQFENEKLQKDNIIFDGENQSLKDENEYLKKILFSFEKKSLDEMKQYQDRALELLHQINGLKQELMEFKNLSNQKENHAINSQKIQNENIFSLLERQKININALSTNIFPSISPINQNIIMKIDQINKEIMDIHLS